MNRLPAVLLIVTLAAALGACVKQPPAQPEAPAPAPPSTLTTPRPTPPAPVTRDTPPQPPVIPVDPPVGVTGDPLTTAAIEAINKDSPMKPVFFAYDSDTLDELARKVIEDNAAILKKYNTWVISIEGHCDERGTAEYNLALGDRRAQAVKNYLVSLGIAAERINTVSFGSEFPFDPGHDEQAWKQNRRAHFMLTAK
jgi:peptidoglycan-associated lipoprotein